MLKCKSFLSLFIYLFFIQVCSAIAGDPSSWGLLDEDCADISDWNDNDEPGCTSSVDPAGQFKFNTGNTAPGTAFAGRSRILASCPLTYSVEIKLYHDDIGTDGAVDIFQLIFYRLDGERFNIKYGSDGLIIHDTDDGWQEVGTDLVKEGGSAEWQTWRFLITYTGTIGNGSCDVYLKNSDHRWRKVGTGITCSSEVGGTAYYFGLLQHGRATDNMISHTDWVKVASGLYAPVVGPEGLKSANGITTENLKSIDSVATANATRIGDPLWYAGRDWVDKGAVSTEYRVSSSAYLGEGIALIGTKGNAEIWKSTDYGKTWAEIRSLTNGNNVRSLSDLENGVALAGTIISAEVWKSTDYGGNWTNIGEVGSGNQTHVMSIAYCGGGIVVAGTYPNAQIVQSTDYGATWSGDVASTGETRLSCLCYLGNGIVLGGSNPSGKLWRSTDYGGNWTDKGTLVVGAEYVYSLADLGHGVVLAGTGGAGASTTDGHICRSIDYGSNWTDLGQLGSERYVTALIYLGNGICIAGSGSDSLTPGKIFRSIDHGLTWENLGELSATEYQVWTLMHLGCGIAVAGTGNPTSPGGRLWRSPE